MCVCVRGCLLRDLMIAKIESIAATVQHVLAVETDSTSITRRGMLQHFSVAPRGGGGGSCRYRGGGGAPALHILRKKGYMRGFRVTGLRSL